MSKNIMSTSSHEDSQFHMSSHEKTASNALFLDEKSRANLGTIHSPSTTYLIESFLGQGGFGTVLQCLKTDTKERVALKKIKSRKSISTDSAKHEVAVLQKLRAFDADKFNFVKFNDSFSVGKYIYIEFEKLEQDLYDFVESKANNRLSLGDIRPILHQVATTLQLLEREGLIHTDLKPNNIMLVDSVNKPLKVKVIDFGLALNASHTEHFQYFQVRHYRAPEVILACHVTTAIDMWSLGIIAAELYLGKVPFPGKSEYDMLRLLMHTQGDIPSKVLNEGFKSREFFHKRKLRCNRRWRFKTFQEYGSAAVTDTMLKSLDDLCEERPFDCDLSKENHMAETADRGDFLDLLKSMLHLDPDKRMTPSKLIEHPFITMNLKDILPSNCYVLSCWKKMEFCHNGSQGSDSSGHEMLWESQPSTSSATSFQPAFTYNFKMTSICEEMEVCPGQGENNDSGDEKMSLDPEPSTSYATLDQNTFDKVPAGWQISPEHPDTPLTAPARSIHEDKSTSDSQLQVPLTCDVTKSFKSEVQPAGNSSRKTFEISFSGERVQDCTKQKRKRLNPDYDQTLKESSQNFVAPTEAPLNTAQVRCLRKRKWDVFTASHSEYRNGVADPPEKKRMKIGPIKDVYKKSESCQIPNEAPTEAPSNTAQVRRPRKRKWDTFVASHSEFRNGVAESPEKKRMKTGPIEDASKKTESCQNSKEDSTVAPSNTAKVKCSRKRKWNTLMASHGEHRAGPADSPEKKRMRGLNEGESKKSENGCSQSPSTCEERADDEPKKCQKKTKESLKKNS